MAKKPTKKVTTKRKVWPWGKPVPRFESEAEELAFWESHAFEPPPDAEGEELVYRPYGSRHPRRHVYNVRLDDREMASLQALARRRGLPASAVIRQLVLSALAS